MTSSGNPYHDELGRFTFGPGGGGGGGATQRRRSPTLSGEKKFTPWKDGAVIVDADGQDGLKLSNEFRRQVKLPPDEYTPRHNELEAALLSQYPGKLVAREGKIAAALSYSVDHDEGRIHVDHFGSVRKGAGGALFKALLDRADEASYDVVLVSSGEARTFYDKFGFKPSGNGAQLIRRAE